MTLDQLKDGQSAVILALDGDHASATRLMEMGLFEGVTVTALRRAPLGDPMELQLGDYRLSLRRAEAMIVEVSA